MTDTGPRPLYVGPWRIDVTVRDGVVSPVSQRALARAIRAALERASAPTPASVGLILSNDEELAQLNAEQMGKEGPTDVLSFPLLRPDAYGSHPGRIVGPVTVSGPPAFALPPGRRVHLGDIVVSVERAAEQAAGGRGGHTGDVRHDAGAELTLLVVHGALHLCGWDHAEPEEETAMRALEREVLGAP